MANVLLRYAASNQPFAGHPPLYHGPLAKGAQHVKESLAEFRVRRRESIIIRFLPRHVRGRKHFARSERRIVRYQRTTEAQNEAVLSRKSGKATFSTVSGHGTLPCPFQLFLSLRPDIRAAAFFFLRNA